MLLAVDPSVSSPGVALFNADNVLVSCARLTVKTEAVYGGRWLFAARTIRGWVMDQMPRHLACITCLVYEKPQIYTWSKSKGDPNDLIGLAGVGSAIAGLLEARWPGLIVDTPTPAEWIGQIPKKTSGSAKESPRAQRILSRLTPSELVLVPDQHDAIDACGLGLWKLGRLQPRLAFSNGRE